MKIITLTLAIVDPPYGIDEEFKKVTDTPS